MRLPSPFMYEATLSCLGGNLHGLGAVPAVVVRGKTPMLHHAPPQPKHSQGVIFPPRWTIVDHKDEAKCPKDSSPLLQPCKDKDYARSHIQRGNGRQEPGEMPMLHHPVPPKKPPPENTFPP